MKIALIKESYYGNGWELTALSWWIIAGVVAAIITAICIVISRYNCRKFEAQCEKIVKLGYKDLDDVQIFCTRIGADLDEFIASKGIRRQYEAFAEGKTSQFIETAMKKKQQDDAEEEAKAKGLAAGMIIGTALNAGLNAGRR